MPQLVYDLAKCYSSQCLQVCFLLQPCIEVDIELYKFLTRNPAYLIYLTEKIPYQICCSKGKVADEAAVIEKKYAGAS